MGSSSLVNNNGCMLNEKKRKLYKVAGESY